MIVPVCINHDWVVHPVTFQPMCRHCKILLELELDRHDEYLESDEEESPERAYDRAMKGVGK